MLLLTRSSDESIIIDGSIKITVLEISDRKGPEYAERMKAEADSKDAA